MEADYDYPFAFPVKPEIAEPERGWAFLVDAAGRDIAEGKYQDIAAIAHALNEGAEGGDGE